MKELDSCTCHCLVCWTVPLVSFGCIGLPICYVYIPALQIAKNVACNLKTLTN